MWTRGQFVTIGAVAGFGVVSGGCTRRERSSATGSSPTLVPSIAGRAADVTARYTAAPMQWSIAGNEVTTWGYNSQLPGTLLRATAGDLVEVTIDNQLPEATSIHWHGLAIRNEMDGVPGVTQPDIEAGTQFTYKFVVPDPGTYWFHPHHGLQLERGLYAPLIIDDPDEHVYAARCCGSSVGTVWGPVASWGCTWSATARVASGSKVCESITRIPSPGFGSTSGWRWAQSRRVRSTWS